MSSDNAALTPPPSTDNEQQPQPQPQQGDGVQRRVGRVERWLRKGYGFIIDLGRLESTEERYGWVKDELSGQKVFVYHNALKSDSNNVFHRLFANEYVEFNIDLSRGRRDDRLQAFDVCGMNSSELLCDINATSNENTEEVRTAAPQRSRRSHASSSSHNNRQGGVPPVPPGATVQYVYYVPTEQNPAKTAPPEQGGASFPPITAPASEPNYVMTSSGIPVPK